MTDVIDHPSRHCFELTIDGHVAISKYSLHDGVITFLHTEVPEALAGKGVGSRLINGALDQARKRGLQVVASCPFVKAYLGKHPEFSDLLK